MNEQKQFEACAELEGLIIFDGQACMVIPQPTTGEATPVPVPNANYNSLDALHRIVCGLDEDTFNKFADILTQIVIPNDPVSRWYGWADILKATPSQWKEALLKATGKWVEDE